MQAQVQAALSDASVVGGLLFEAGAPAGATVSAGTDATSSGSGVALVSNPYSDGTDGGEDEGLFPTDDTVAWIGIAVGFAALVALTWACLAWCGCCGRPRGRESSKAVASAADKATSEGSVPSG